VSAELRPSSGSDLPEADGDAESWSELLKSFADAGGVGVSWFMATRTEAASKS